MPNLNMNFTVNKNAVVCNMLNGEIQGRMKSRNNPTLKQAYRERGIIDSTPAITKFILNHPKVFGNEKLIHRDGSNFFEGILPVYSSPVSTSSRETLRSRMRYEYDLTDSEVSSMDRFFDDFQTLADAPEIQKIVSDTEDYKNSIEEAWQTSSPSIMRYIKDILGYEPENKGTVSTFIMYPTFDVHRCSQDSNKTNVFFARRKDNDIGKILSYLTHQVVHEVMIPYKASMTKAEKQDYHAFIKFLTDKDVYCQLSGKSYLENITQEEDPVVMGKIYPFWLGYRYRNADKEGLDPVEQISEAIQRDKAYFDELPENSKKRKFYSRYNFDKLDPVKIAMLFREKRGITPYQFAKTDFSRTDLVYQERFVQSKRKSASGEER